MNALINASESWQKINDPFKTQLPVNAVFLESKFKLDSVTVSFGKPYKSHLLKTNQN